MPYGRRGAHCSVALPSDWSAANRVDNNNRSGGHHDAQSTPNWPAASRSSFVAAAGPSDERSSSDNRLAFAEDEEQTMVFTGNFGQNNAGSRESAGPSSNTHEGVGSLAEVDPDALAILTGGSDQNDRTDFLMNSCLITFLKGHFVQTVSPNINGQRRPLGPYANSVEELRQAYSLSINQRWEENDGVVGDPERTVDPALLGRFGRCVQYPNYLREMHSRLCKILAEDLRKNNAPEEALVANSNAAWDFYASNCQCTVHLERKVLVFAKMMYALQDCMLSFRMSIIGSSFSGFANETSDMDVCLLWHPEVAEVHRRSLSLDLLRIVGNVLAASGLVAETRLIAARVPILRLDLLPPFEDIQVDLNVNNPNGIRNTYLLRTYAQYDWRVSTLVMLIKKWARSHGVNNASRGTLSSYTIELLVINYLQCGVYPPVVPSFQEVCPDDFSAGRPIEELRCDETKRTSCAIANVFNVKCLFFLFFRHYCTHCDFSKEIVSVRQGRMVSFEEIRSVAGHPGGDVNNGAYMYVEEPYSLENTAYAVHDEQTFRMIIRLFRDSYQRCLFTSTIDAAFGVQDHQA
uniref:PAP-associated domain-containing protein n=1 Tax=Trichuris muris TaxID=70415 RepID=A0A5S6QBX4_TRIMR